MKQLELFGDRQDRSWRPAANRTRTSIAAAEAIADMAPTLRGRVYEAIAGAGDGGLTRAEISERCGMKLQTVCGRANELLKMGLIYQTAEARDGGKVLRANRF